jgi:predicted site-specific integrase-resolvase
MTKAALYARVSTDAQKQEGTIKSQVLELKRQIVAAGHVLVKEYIDDGLSGTQFDRQLSPAANIRAPKRVPAKSRQVELVLTRLATCAADTRRLCRIHQRHRVCRILQIRP